tara:strand:+ start:14086 stop:14319 length:234 start_codon:yes stop_codon:yes gene_type:complete
MTNKEKAKELVEKFAQIQRDFNQQNYYGQAKKSALICVDEIISYEDEMITQLDIDPHLSEWTDLIDWQEVKQEINKL